jgi:mannose-1-phosphate guanylyltransferase
MLPTLILTAGLGTRLDPLTRLVAKPAVPLGSRTLIERVLDWIRRQGIEEVVLNLHHRPATLTGVVGDGAHLGLRVRYSWEQPVLGSAGGPRHALPLLDGDPLLMVNGDTLSDVDLAPMLEAHHRSGADVTLAVVPNPAPDHYNGITRDEAGRVTGFVPRGRAAGSWHFIGVQIAARRVFEALADGIPAETIGGIYRDLLASGPGRLHGWTARTTFTDVGTPRDYLAAALAFGAEPAGSAQPGRLAGLRQSVVWPEARLAADVSLDECVVAGPVRLPAGFQARRAVVVPASILRDDDRVSVRDGVAIFPLDPYNDARG